MESVSSDERIARLQNALADLGRFGRVTPIGPYQAQVTVPGSKVNHAAHAVITLLTLGLWLPVWGLFVYFSKPERTDMISVDEHGEVWINKRPDSSGGATTATQ